MSNRSLPVLGEPTANEVHGTIALHPRRLRRRNTMVLVALLAAATMSSCSNAPTSEVLRLDASINGVSLGDTSPRKPLRLNPKTEETLLINISNATAKPVTVDRIRLEGEMLSLNFLSYDVRIKTPVAAGGTRTLEVPLDFFDLDRQATGYLRGHLRLYDESKKRLASTTVMIDVRGSILSTMGVFSLLLLALVTLGIARNIRDVKRRRLPERRFARGLRFLAPGLGFGLLLSVGFAVLRIFPLPTTGWILLTAIPTIAGFAVGYFLTPGLSTDDTDGIVEDDDDDLEDEDVVASMVNADAG